MLTFDLTVSHRDPPTVFSHNKNRTWFWIRCVPVVLWPPRLQQTPSLPPLTCPGQWNAPGRVSRHAPSLHVQTHDAPPGAPRRAARSQSTVHTQASMRRFFRAHRDEDYSQIQYLTAKCTRLAHDKAVLDREFLVSREKERKLQNDLEAVTSRLLQQEHLNVELVMNQDKLLRRIQEQQELLNLLQQRVLQLAEESRRDVALLQEVGAELHCLQSSEVELQGLVEELFVELQHRASLSEKLQAELLRREEELGELHDTNRGLREELKELHRTHQEETTDQRTQVTELQLQNDRSLRKLQETAEQFEWLCQQQRCWMSCVKRWKESLVEDRQTLLRHICKLEEKAASPRMSSHDATQSLPWPLPETCDRFHQPELGSACSNVA
ncbi:hypothetical protein OJAV_G00104600 [Oryzias javanicus]|uniref:Uncharacterized protein n=1 Tax=Oryzias javanicus TaxID=123683 RepID=A0A437CY91_ORYJA|nr:hypothetical protein OJAV_G00104600 [Oryzias javanicus]